MKIFIFGCLLSSSLFLHAQDSEKTLNFSGYEWIIKDYPYPIGPGSNFFSQKAVESGDDSLTLSLQPRLWRWFCGEVYSRDFFSYGTFTLEFYIPHPLDRQSVFGFFLYNDRVPAPHNEIDFEISRWGQEESPPFSFSVQPYETPGNSRSFSAPEQGVYSCRIVWSPREIRFTLSDGGGRILKEWAYRGDDIPRETESRVHLNLWLFEGESPGGDGEDEVYIHSFTYENSY